MSRLIGSVLIFCLSVLSSVITHEYQGRIVNGTDAAPAEFPFIVSLRRVSGGRHSCGASLINRSWVLTAAHCVARALPTMINIQFGSTDLNPNSADIANISKIFVHKGYAPRNKYIHDIALLKLKEPVTFSDAVQAVRLPKMQEFTPGNSTAILLGWGLNAVSLRRTFDGKHFCAGTIINPHWILTAAHCFTFIKNATELFVQYGSIALNTEAKRVTNVVEILKHDGYNPTVTIHDIALLKLEAPLHFNENVRAVQLPKTIHKFIGGEGVTLMGWGLNKTNGGLQETLQKINLQLVSNTDCKNQLSSFIHVSNLCAGSDSKAIKGQCSGDSGGPLLYQGIQIGIVSWSLKPCAIKPGVFTNVTYYIEWIIEKIKFFC